MGTFIINGLKVPGAQLPSAAAGLGLLALNYGCNFDPDAGKPPASSLPVSGCYESVGGAWLSMKVGPTATSFGPAFRKFISLVDTGIPGNYGTTRWEMTYVDGLGVTQVYGVNRTVAEMTPATIKLTAGKTCAQDGPPGYQPPGPVNFTDPVTNCNMTVELEGWAGADAGNLSPVLKISPAAQSFASGGVIGGCNFNPIIYVGPPGGGGGGGTVIPWEPGPDGDDGEPWWWDVVKSALGSVVGAAINRLIDKLLEEKSPAVVYRLVSVCEKDAQGEAISQAREVTIPQLPILDGLVARMDAMDDLMQGLKDFKQPICEPEPPAAPVGRNISIQFRSDGVSPFGKEALRKVFRYRDPSLKDLEEHREHWKDFEWESGPWMVISEGLVWGKPQVWAKSEAEGKRVLTHAAQISGVDLNSSSHRWRVHQAVGYRERPVMKMKVHRDVNGRLWIAERTGSDGLPMVLGQLSSDPGVEG
ncbi:MAG: hypothetical protein QM522_10665 [Chitinophagaceae bacterium]|nr:hypothetical protein [Chitinophagaceae bacterium]